MVDLVSASGRPRSSDRHALYVSFVLHLLLAGLLLITAFGDTAIAATYYVDAVNGSDSNGGTSVAPWKTMDKVSTSSQAGDTIIIKQISAATFYPYGSSAQPWPGGRTYKAGGTTQWGITWTFDQNYTIGRFANGDYWVVGPVTIIAIDPPSTKDLTTGRTINGSMLNITPQKDAKQGFDSVAPGYDSSYNVARPNGNDLGVSNLLVIQPNHSLVSSISVAGGGQIQDAAVLTILGSAPPASSFRPSWAGTDKTIKHNVSDLDYSGLSSLTPVASTPRLKQLAGDKQSDSVERMFERLWIDFQFSLGNTHPSNNMPAYGANMAQQMGDAALVLNLNYSNSEKQTLMIRLVRLGIDFYPWKNRISAINLSFEQISVIKQLCPKVEAVVGRIAHLLTELSR